MPRTKKAPGEAVDRRNGAQLILLPPVNPVVPKPPAGLLRPTAEAWDSFWHDPVSNLVTPASRSLVDRWVIVLDELNRARSGFRRKRFMQGSQGQPVLNPLGAEAHRLSAELTSIEDRLGMSPRSQMALGIAFGQAKKSLDELNRELAVSEDGNDDADLDFDIVVCDERTASSQVD
jgi:hypothetical protein